MFRIYPYSNCYKKLHLIIAMVIGLFLLISCAGNGAGGKKESRTYTGFPYVEVPGFITDDQESMLYLTKNFWNRYFREAEKDTSLYSMNIELLEEACTNYIALLNIVYETAQESKAVSGNGFADKAFSTIASSQKKLFAKADSLYLSGNKKLLVNLIKLSEQYLYDPNSSYLNEENYIPVLEAILNLKALDSLNKISYKYQLDLALLNRVGTKANDFEYTYIAKNGIRKKGSLYGIEAEYLLIYFNNPDCGSCKEEQGRLMSEPLIAQMCVDGSLVVLAMYIDEQTDLWENNFKNIPDSWVYAKDHKLVLRNNELYGIRAIPSMYLLDRDKKVLLKDAVSEKVIQYILRTNVR